MSKSPLIWIILGVCFVFALTIGIYVLSFHTPTVDDLYEEAKQLPEPKAEKTYTLDKDLDLTASLPADFQPKANGLEHQQLKEIEVVVDKAPAKGEQALMKRFEERKEKISNDKRMREIMDMKVKQINGVNWAHTRHEYREESSFREEWYAAEHKGQLVEVLLRYPLGAFGFTIEAGQSLGSSLKFKTSAEAVKERTTQMDALTQ